MVSLKNNTDSSLFPHLKPWKGLSSDKSANVNFLCQYINQLNNDKDLFESGEYYPKEFDEKQTPSLLNCFLGFGITMLRNAVDKKSLVQNLSEFPIRSILNIKINLNSYLLKPNNDIDEKLFRAVAVAFNIKLVVHDCKEQSFNEIKRFNPINNSRARTIHVVNMDKEFLFVYSSNEINRTDIIDEGYLDNASKGFYEAISKVKVKENDDE